MPRGSVVRRYFLACRASLGGRRHVLQLPVQMAQLLLQQVNLLLLAIDRAVEFFDKVFGQADPAFDFDEALAHRRASGRLGGEAIDDRRQRIDRINQRHHHAVHASEHTHLVGVGAEQHVVTGNAVDVEP